MPASVEYDDDYIDVAKELVSALEINDHESANRLINDLRSANESVIFQEIGKLTRELHDTLQGFELDINISDLAKTGIPDAKMRLNYVIEKTQEAADSTLTIIEKHVPVCDRLGKESVILSEDWARFTAKEMNADEFRLLSKRMTKYFEDNKSSYKDIMIGMQEITMAQSFQDITGQVIKKVIALVQDVEDNLIRVIKVTGISSEIKNKQGDPLEGPQVPGLSSADDVVTGQDEVDDLLSSLGF